MCASFLFCCKLVSSSRVFHLFHLNNPNLAPLGWGFQGWILTNPTVQLFKYITRHRKLSNHHDHFLLSNHQYKAGRLDSGFLEPLGLDSGLLGLPRLDSGLLGPPETNNHIEQLNCRVCKIKRSSVSTHTCTRMHTGLAGFQAISSQIQSSWGLLDWILASWNIPGC